MRRAFAQAAGAGQGHARQGQDLLVPRAAGRVHRQGQGPHAPRVRREGRLRDGIADTTTRATSTFRWSTGFAGKGPAPC